MKHTRLILGIILILLLFALMLYYSLDHNNHDPDTQYILDHYEKFTTTKVELDAVVKNVDKINNTLYIQVSSSPEGIIQVNTTEPLTTVQPGDQVEVYGTFTSRNHMIAEKFLISNQWASDLNHISKLIIY